MEKLIDYTKYTLALAVGLLLYIPANFIPAPEGHAFKFLAFVLVILVISIVTGIALYTRATTILVKNDAATQDEKGWTRFWGNCHLWSLILAFLCIAPYYGYHKVWLPSSKVECALEVPMQDGQKLKLTYSCKSETVPKS